jgi:hypothetical protein
MHLYPVEKSVITLDSLLGIDDLQNCTTFLDWGGNQGNLLSFDNFPIEASNYTCVDVDSYAIKIGKQTYPEANFIHWNRFSKVYNETGNTVEPFPELDPNQDVIFAFSVFTHTDFTEFKETLDWMKSYFNYKKIIISLIGTNSTKLLERFYNRRVERRGFSVDIRELANEPNTNMAYLTDHDQLDRNEESSSQDHCETFLVFYNTEWIAEQMGGTIHISHELEYPYLVITP